MTVESRESRVESSEATAEETRPRETRAAKILPALEALLFSSPGPVK
jgi:hypothetical protein